METGAVTKPAPVGPAAPRCNAKANRGRPRFADPAIARVGVLHGTKSYVMQTADGQIRDCLFATGETDLRALLRGGYSDEEIANVWRRAMWGKKPGHGINDPSFLSPDRPMSAIGG